MSSDAVMYDQARHAIHRVPPERARTHVCARTVARAHARCVVRCTQHAMPHVMMHVMLPAACACRPADARDLPVRAHVRQPRRPDRQARHPPRHRWVYSPPNVHRMLHLGPIACAGVHACIRPSPRISRQIVANRHAKYSGHACLAGGATKLCCADLLTPTSCLCCIA